MEEEVRFSALEDDFDAVKDDLKRILLDIRAFLMEAGSPLRSSNEWQRDGEKGARK